MNVYNLVATFVVMLVNSITNIDGSHCISRNLDALEQRLEKARSLKTGMMQELLTGKTRLIKTDKKQEAP